VAGLCLGQPWENRWQRRWTTGGRARWAWTCLLVLDSGVAAEKRALSESTSTTWRCWWTVMVVVGTKDQHWQG